MIEKECENTNPCDIKCEHFSLWYVSYHTITDDKRYEGVSIVRARDGKHAENVLKSNSVFNGTQENITIDIVAQVPTLSESGLCFEAYTDGSTQRINYGV